MPRRPLVIDVSKDLPPRLRPLTAEAIKEIFGGCKDLFTSCTQNYECCSFHCWRMWWISAENRWTYECLPYENRYH